MRVRIGLSSVLVLTLLVYACAVFDLPENGPRGSWKGPQNTYFRFTDEVMRWWVAKNNNCMTGIRFIDHYDLEAQIVKFEGQAWHVKAYGDSMRLGPLKGTFRMTVHRSDKDLPPCPQKTRIQLLFKGQQTCYGKC